MLFTSTSDNPADCRQRLGSWKPTLLIFFIPVIDTPSPDSSSSSHCRFLSLHHSLTLSEMTPRTLSPGLHAALPPIKSSSLLSQNTVLSWAPIHSPASAAARSMSRSDSATPAADSCGVNVGDFISNVKPLVDALPANSLQKHTLQLQMAEFDRRFNSESHRDEEVRSVLLDRIFDPECSFTAHHAAKFARLLDVSVPWSISRLSQPNSVKRGQFVTQRHGLTAAASLPRLSFTWRPWCEASRSKTPLRILSASLGCSRSGAFSTAASRPPRP